MKTQLIHDWAASRGMASRVLPIASLDFARDRLARLAADGALDPWFVREALSGFRYLDGRAVKAPAGPRAPRRG